MDFPLTDLMDQDACYARLVEALHPDGLTCPRCGGDRLGVHRRLHAPVLYYRCRDCRRIFNAFTGTALQKTCRSPAALVLILRGIVQSAPTAWMARELGCGRMKLHKLQGEQVSTPPPGSTRPRCPMRRSRLTSASSTRGKKGFPYREPHDPPRRLANKQCGHGTFANDRPSVAASIGRDSGRACLQVVGNSDRRTLEGLVQTTTAPGAMFNTDEWRAFGRAPELGRGNVTVNHGAGEWAHDDDGDGVQVVLSTRWRGP